MTPPELPEPPPELPEPAVELAEPPPELPEPAVELPEAVVELLRRHGVGSRGLRHVLRLLAGDRAMTVAELVAATGVPRRSVQGLLGALADRVEEHDERVRLVEATAAGADPRTGPRTGPAVGPPVPAPGAASAEPDREGDRELLARLDELIAGAPRGRRALDHVAATAETALRRARLMHGRFWLPGARLLCLGDHDLTSLAATLVCPELEVVVVDVDDRVLAYIDDRASRLGLRVTCLFGDLRLGLPPAAAGCADLVFTDPPYTPEGVGVFARRGLEGLRDRAEGRLLLAYGASPATPGLAARVQDVLHELRLLYTALWPAFNRYHGAQALGSVSDLYELRPTARTWIALRTARPVRSAIYTHGPQSAEAEVDLDPETAGRAVASARPGTIVGAWPAGTASGRTHLTLATWLARPHPQAPGPVLVNLAGGYAATLPRALLACRAEEVHLVVDNAAVGTERAQRELAGLVAPRYTLRFLRGTPGPRHAMVVARRITAEAAGAAGAAGTAPIAAILDRAHGKIGNSWREALVSLARDRGETLTKNAARDQVEAASPVPLDLTPLELPAHRLRRLVAAAG